MQFWFLIKLVVLVNYSCSLNMHVKRETSPLYNKIEFLFSYFIMFCSYIRRIARTHAGSLWVGLTDRGTEGTWRFITSNKYFEPNKGNTLFQWSVRDGVKEPNNGDGLQHCACFWFKGMNLDDQSCSNQLHGLCEIKTFT